MLELLIGQIPEAIYFALFMIFVKGLKEKRLIFTILMVLEYILLLQAMPFSIYAEEETMIEEAVEETIEITEIKDTQKNLKWLPKI